MYDAIENPMVSMAEPDEERVCFQCDDCGEDIYEGDDFYEVDNETNYCMDCMNDRKKEAIYSDQELTELLYGRKEE
jgi:hypothetical protein